MDAKEVKPDSKDIKDAANPENKTEVKKPEEKKPDITDSKTNSETRPELKDQILAGSKPQYKIDWEQHKRVELIEIKIKKINQLFNSFDPSPFLEKDLDDDAFEYIVSAVGEHHIKVKQIIVIYMPKFEKKKISEAEITKAIHHYFDYKKVLADRSIKLKLQEGQTSLFIGILFLASCLFLRQFIISNFDNLAMNILAEGLIIGGWVAMWKPISNLLYDWWPVRKEKKIYEKISKMEVEFRYI